MQHWRLCRVLIGRCFEIVVTPRYPFSSRSGQVKLTVVYFMRPETDAVFFVDREGKQSKSVDWRNMKQRLFAKDLEAQKTNLGLTGRLGHNDLWDGKVAA